MSKLIYNLKLFKDVYDSYYTANVMLRCRHEDCGLYIRYYQHKFYNAICNEERCVHCNRIGLSHKYGKFESLWMTYPKYLDNSIEAPKASIITWYKVKKCINQLEQVRLDSKEILGYLDFQEKRSEDILKQIQWLRNLDYKEKDKVQ